MVDYTDEEQKALLAVEAKYKKELSAARKKLHKFDLSTQPDEYFAASNEYASVVEKIGAERDVIFNQAYLRGFKSFNNDVSKMVNALKNQLLSFIYMSKVFAGDPPTEEDLKARERNEKDIARAVENNKKLIEDIRIQISEATGERVKELTEDLEELIFNTEDLERTDLSSIYEATYSPAGLQKRINENFSLYFDFIKKADPQAFKELQEFIDSAIERRDELELADDKTISSAKEENTLTVKNTIFPTCFITPKDKVSNYLFVGEISATDELLSTEKNGSKKELTVKTSINYDELQGVTIAGKKELAPYDREIHDSIVSLIEVGNNPISPLMILRTMTGNPEATLNPTQEKAIDESVHKLFFSKLRIDASGEAVAYKMEKAIYEGYLIAGEKALVKHKGNEPQVWYNILRSPVLYDYAKSKKQIAQIPINLLYTPVNKNEDTIIIQGYLYRRILTMKGSTGQSNAIVLQTVFKYANMEDITRDKKKRVTNYIRIIMDDWKKKNFIINYTVNKKGNSIYSFSIEY